MCLLGDSLYCLCCSLLFLIITWTVALWPQKKEGRDGIDKKGGSHGRMMGGRQGRWQRWKKRRWTRKESTVPFSQNFAPYNSGRLFYTFKSSSRCKKGISARKEKGKEGNERTDRDRKKVREWLKENETERKERESARLRYCWAQQVSDYWLASWVQRGGLSVLGLGKQHESEPSVLWGWLESVLAIGDISLINGWCSRGELYEATRAQSLQQRR